jgi:hypothetical protein
MPSVLKHTECPACGHRHHFCLPTDNLMPGREYAYVCPETAKKATLRPMSSAEVVHAPPQGAVALTPAVYDSPPGPGHEAPVSAATSKPPPQTRPDSGHPQPVDPGLPKLEREMHQIGREVQGLTARVGELEEKVTTAPLPAGANEPEAGPSHLQEVLPEVKDLAGKVGGLEKLSDIVETLKDAKQE